MSSLQPYIRLVFAKVVPLLLAAIHAILLLISFDDLHVVQKLGLQIFVLVDVVQPLVIELLVHLQGVERPEDGLYDGGGRPLVVLLLGPSHYALVLLVLFVLAVWIGRWLLMRDLGLRADMTYLASKPNKMMIIRKTTVTMSLIMKRMSIVRSPGIMLMRN